MEGSLGSSAYYFHSSQRRVSLLSQSWIVTRRSCYSQTLTKDLIGSFLKFSSHYYFSSAFRSSGISSRTENSSIGWFWAFYSSARSDTYSSIAAKAFSFSAFCFLRFSTCISAYLRSDSIFCSSFFIWFFIWPSSGYWLFFDTTSRSLGFCGAGWACCYSFEEARAI